MGVFLLGILGGIALSLCFSFGPAFFSQLQASIHYGFRNAVSFAYGVSTSDILVVSILLLLTSRISIDEMMLMLSNRWIISIGAAVIAGFGIYTMFVKTRHSAEINSTDRIALQNVQIPSRLSIYFRGLMLNFMNPAIWLYWTAIVAMVICGDDYDVSDRFLFFGGVLVATLGLDVLKCKLASLLRRVITFRFLSIFNKCIGVILVGFALYMVIATIPGATNDSVNKSDPTKVIQQIKDRPPHS